LFSFVFFCACHFIPFVFCFDQVLLENIDLHLSEDRSAVSQLSASNPVPLDVCISRLRVARTASGTFHIEPAGQYLENNYP
jgi:hypothetical protein